jgi:chorismate dehydratase
LKPRIAASSYLNTAPLIWSFIHGPRAADVEWQEAVPARCAELLAAGDVDYALVPVIEFQRIPDLSVVPDVCVGSRQKVRSVVLVTRKNNLKKIERVALDESSRTSATLIKIIFKEFLHSDPQWNPSRPDLRTMLRENDAALIIGDPAMTFDRTNLQVFDLASVWREETGHGFVFAMWMSRHNQISQIDFASARDEGVAHVDEIVQNYVERLPLSKQELREYLTNNISFYVDEDMHRGLDLYFELAKKHGLIDEKRELQYWK